MSWDKAIPLLRARNIITQNFTRCPRIRRSCFRLAVYGQVSPGIPGQCHATDEADTHPGHQCLKRRQVKLIETEVIVNFKVTVAQKEETESDAFFNKYETTLSFRNKFLINLVSVLRGSVVTRSCYNV